MLRLPGTLVLRLVPMLLLLSELWWMAGEDF